MKDLSFNTISACNIELDATVFESAQNKPNFPPTSPMSLSALRFWPRRGRDEVQSNAGPALARESRLKNTGDLQGAERPEIQEKPL
jgi:hypothetical protein